MINDSLVSSVFHTSHTVSSYSVPAHCSRLLPVRDPYVGEFTGLAAANAASKDHEERFSVLRARASSVLQEYIPKRSIPKLPEAHEPFRITETILIPPSSTSSLSPLVTAAYESCYQI
jgi:hypothetical protein